MATARRQEEDDATRETLPVVARDQQPDAREGQAGPGGESERPIVPRKPGNAGGGKGPQFKRVSKEATAGRLVMSLQTSDETVEKLQTALHTKAKADPKYRFYALYDKMYRKDVLGYAYECCRANGGSGSGRPDVRGHRGRTGWTKWLGELAEELKNEDVSTPSGPAGMDPEGRWEAATAGDPDDPGPSGADGGGAGPRTDLRGGPAAGAIRLPGRSKRALDAVRSGAGTAGSGLYGSGRRGLERLFRQHPARRTDEVGGSADQSTARAALIKMWLEAPVEETDERGGSSERPATRTRDEARRKVALLSPLLANLYMRRFILGWKRTGPRGRVWTLTSSTMRTTS